MAEELTKGQIAEKLAKHKAWLCGGAAGARADFSGADLGLASLSGVNLSCANLSGANLRGADLAVADLRGANLSGADLRMASLRGADLGGADLYGADLSRAYLYGACLRAANVSGAYFYETNLHGADVYGASLNKAYLYGAYLGEDRLTALPVMISLYPWDVVISDTVIRIGCQTHTTAEWESFSDGEIDSMHQRQALEFWRRWKGAILAMAHAHQDSLKPYSQAEADRLKEEWQRRYGKI